MDRSLDLGLLNIWCELEDDILKTLLYKVHTRTGKVGPLVAKKNSLIQENNLLGSEPWPFGVNLIKIHRKQRAKEQKQENKKLAP